MRHPNESLKSLWVHNRALIPYEELGESQSTFEPQTLPPEMDFSGLSTEDVEGSGPLTGGFPWHLTYCWLVGNEGMRYPVSPNIYPLRDYMGCLIPSSPTNQQ